MRLYVPTTLDLLRVYRDSGVIPADVARIAAANTSEEAEYLALMTAADASAALGGDRRVVLVAERPIEDGGIYWSELAALHADHEPFVDPDDEPGWYGVQEVSDLLAWLAL